MHCRHRFDVFAVEFAGLEDGFLVPVGPVDVVFERGDGERMPQVVCRVEDHRPFGPVIVARGDSVQFGIDL